MIQLQVLNTFGKSCNELAVSGPFCLIVYIKNDEEELGGPVVSASNSRPSVWGFRLHMRLHFTQ